MINLNFIKDVESNSVSLRLRKAYTGANISSRSVLTDDVFSYIDFWFKKHKKILKTEDGKKVEQDHSFYWKQAKNFYFASKALPLESAPLPMYYCMLNAIKAYIFYNAKTFDEIKNDFNSHGLHEGVDKTPVDVHSLDNIFIQRVGWGVFTRFSNMLEEDFSAKWQCSKKGKFQVSVKDLMYQLPFIHSAYISTYSLPQKHEKFIPLIGGSTPSFRYGKDRKIRLVVDIEKKYFKQDATGLPEIIKETIPDEFEVNKNNGFQLISKRTLKKNEISGIYRNYRKYFSYIAADKRIWYLKRNNNFNSMPNLNSMIVSVAIMHRFSEIVRYKPEQMYRLLNGKENWLIHEFLSMALDQFMDEISCEITKEEIMHTRVK